MLATTFISRGFGYPVQRNGSPLCALLIRTGSRSDRVRYSPTFLEKTTTRSLRLPVLIICLQQLFNRMARPLLGLFAKRRDSAGSFVFRDALDAPHGKKQIPKTDKWFVVNYRAHPIVECIQVEAAQEYAGLINLVEHAPTFFARTVENDDDCRSRIDSGISCRSFAHRFAPRCLRPL
jgi:hypothetical protein